MGADYLYALGNNEDGAKYSGIDTDKMKIIAYVLCSFCAGMAGILFAFELDSVQPAQTGEFYELYAIAAAVLGGCSLRGGGVHTWSCYRGSRYPIDLQFDQHGWNFHAFGIWYFRYGDFAGRNR